MRCQRSAGDRAEPARGDADQEHAIGIDIGLRLQESCGLDDVLCAGKPGTLVIRLLAAAVSLGKVSLGMAIAATRDEADGPAAAGKCYRVRGEI